MTHRTPKNHLASDTRSRRTPKHRSTSVSYPRRRTPTPRQLKRQTKRQKRKNVVIPTAPVLEGLTSSQVAAKIAAGKVNRVKKSATGSVGKIILKNTITIFNFVNLVLALMIILVGSYKNLLFIFVAIANTLISIINEIRAKRTIDKMRLVAEQKPTVIRDGENRQIPARELVEGDLTVLSLGDQILVDSRVNSGEIEVNEAYVTGEQDNILKRPGDQLVSGSFVVSGTCKATVTSVGSDNFINKLESSARTIKPTNSKLFIIMNNIVKYISFALIPIGILLLWRRFSVPDTTLEVAVTSTVAALINMIPEGLILLTSSVLALATIRLAKKAVLVQDLYAIETLARVDCICLDKTGTLTTGKMRVSRFIPAPGKTLKTLQDAFRAILGATTADNATSAALRAKLQETAKIEPTEQIDNFIPFSSERKYSGLRTPDGEILMGALEFITSDPQLLAQEAAFQGDERVISVVRRTKNCDELLGFALLEDEIRHDAPEIIDFFRANDVAVKVISGDNLTTVRTIADKVGLEHLAAVDLSLAPKPLNYRQLAENYQIFTRVTPAQKKQLILAFKKQGCTVAMTGDGVNDILAMKEADCSIAIGEGADAARRSAKLVLLGSDFASVPSIIAEGRQTVNNLERSTTLFLTKTVYASILAVFFALIPLAYPYSPIEMTLLNFLCIGLPGFVLALETNTARIKDQFVHNIKKFSVPTGVTVAISMIALAILAHNIAIARPDLLTISAVLTFAINFTLIYRISRPLTPFRTLLLGVILAAFTAVILIVPIRMLFVM